MTAEGHQASLSPNNESPAPHQTVWVKLSKLEVRKFNRNLGQWQELWDLFESAVNLNESLLNVDKFSYLADLLLETAR